MNNVNWEKLFSAAMQFFLATAICVIVGAVLFALLLGGAKVDPSMKEFVFSALGILLTLLVQVFSYSFGSSQGSKLKDSPLARIVKDKL